MKVYISEDLYNKINQIGRSSSIEQVMTMGAKTTNDNILIDSTSFCHFDNPDIVKRDKDSIEIKLDHLIEEMKKNQFINDTFFMVHSHPIKTNLLEFMYGDLSDTDEIISRKLREVASKFNLKYYDGITTGKKVYFWSTYEKEPELMECFIDNKKIDYNSLTTITEKIEHKMK